MKKPALLIILVVCTGLLHHFPAATAAWGQQNGEDRAIRVGESFNISLESNRSTGYQWKLAGQLDQKVIKLVSSDYVGPAKQIPGAGGKEEWIFLGVGPGKTVIHLEYVRPWEKGGAPARTATYSIVVK